MDLEKPQSDTVTPSPCCVGKGGYSLTVVKCHDVSDLVGLTRVRFSGRMHVCRGCRRARFDAGGLDDAHALIMPTIIEGKIPVSPGVVRYIRDRLDLSQEQLGRTIGMGRQTVHRWESGSHVPPIRDAILLRALLAIYFAAMARSTAIKLRRLEVASRAFDVLSSDVVTVVIGRGLQYEVAS